MECTRERKRHRRAGIAVRLDGLALASVSGDLDQGDMRLRCEAAFAHLCGSPPSPPTAARPAGIGCTVAATATPTGPCTWPWWSDAVLSPHPRAPSFWRDVG